MSIHEGNKLIKHGLCNVPFPIRSWEGLKVDFMLDGLAEVAHETDIDVRLKESGADFLEGGVKLLLSGMPRECGRLITFSSMGAVPWRSRKAVVSRRPRSERTIVQETLLALVGDDP